ncbi:UNVERIFIED_CONTAM: hypothetical protein GTU68_067198 [Idotea baltica]|nr:hypothetical protein [Idotea baltica]
MSEIILSESSAIRIGCLSGPNLAGELADGQPAATVIASRFDQVIKWGKACLRSETFRVYESYDLIGVELAGVLKNVLAIASGILHGLGLGENAKAMLITRGLTEMVKLGKALGAESDAFFGIAGIGDLIATCSSTKSRNFTVGFKLAKGASLDEILKEMSEVAEGVYTCKIAYLLSEYYKLETPIIKTLFQLIHQKRSLAESMQFLLTHHMDQDIEYHKL